MQGSLLVFPNKYKIHKHIIKEEKKFQGKTYTFPALLLSTENPLGTRLRILHNIHLINSWNN